MFRTEFKIVLNSGVVKKAVDAESMKNIFCSDHVQIEK